jgi:type I restriction enzyme S subunit
MQVKNKTLVAGLHTYIARPKESQLVIGFSGYFFQSAIMRKQIMRMAQGVSVLGISKGNMDKLRFPLPHPKEQQKIAQTLSTLDNKIAAAATHITQLKTFKKGLLQQMFV